MKKLLIISAVMLALVSVNMPISAQVLKGSKGNAGVVRNPVRYQSAGAYSDGRGVWLEWKTEIEAKNLGFYIYRVSGGERELVSPALIAGAYLQATEEKIFSGSYSFYDPLGDVDSVYVLESYNAGGQRHYSNTIQTQYIDDLTKIAGASSEQLNAQSSDAEPLVLGNESVLPLALAAEIAENSLQADPNTQRWVAAQPGVKIGVNEEGFYRVSRSDLQTNGFDVNAPVERWQLYAGGVEQAINVGANGDYIEFYGRGINTLDSETQIYFLVVGTQNGKRIGSAFRRRVGGSVFSESYSQSFYKKERQSYTSAILNGDAENYFGSIIGATAATFNFNLSGVDFGSVNSSLDLTIQGITTTSHNVKVIINGVEIGTITGSNFNSMVKHFDFPTSALREGANSLQLMSLNPSGDFTMFDSMKINFARRYRAEQNRISFHVPNYKANYVENFTSPNIRVFDTTNPDAPTLISGLTVEQTGGTYRVLLPSNRGRVMYAVADSGFSTAASLTRNYPSTLSTAANVGELIIITHKNFSAPAEEWATYRRGQGLSVKVVDIDDVFDEFNYGVLSPDSIRSFLQYAKNNWQTAPNYALLIGDATYDPKNYIGGASGNFIPTRMVDTIYSETGSDETMADFNDDGLAEIAIGRIPHRTAAGVTLLLNKITTFELTVGQGLTSRGAIFASDLADGYDFEGVNNRLCMQLQLMNPVTCYKINRALPNANAVLVGEMNNGRFLVNYTGHGNIAVWANTSFFSTTHAGQLTNTNKSIYTMLTCLNGYFINPTDSLSEVLLKNENGGAVSTWASTGLTTPDVQETMAMRFYNQIAVGNITRIGDLIKDAKTTINFGRDVRLSWALLGDPTMKVK